MSGPPPWFWWEVAIKLAPRLWKLLVEGEKAGGEIRLRDVLDYDTVTKWERQAALAKAKQRIKDAGG